MNKLLLPLSRVLFDSDMLLTRMMLAFSEFVWAILLLWDGCTFCGRPTYTGMSHVMNEEAWGFIFLLSGVTQLTIVLNECYHDTWARFFAGWNAGLWTFVVIAMLMSVYPPPAAISAEIIMSLSAIWLWVRPYILADIYTKGYSRARAK